MQTNIKNPNWRLKRTALERCFTLLLAYACIAVNCLISGHIAEAFSSKMFTTCPENFTQSNFCLSSECIHSASSMLSKMKPEIEPCDDFYQFACGTFEDETQVPEEKMAINSFSIVSDKVHRQLKDIIVEERHDTEPKYLKLPNALYKACMNKTLINKLGAEPIQRLAHILGGWPVIEGNRWDVNNSWTWQDAVKNSKRLGFPINFLIGFSVSEDFKNNKKRIIYLDQPIFGVSHNYLIKGLNETLVAAYYNYMVDEAVLFDADRETAKKELKESLEFEIALAKISLSSERRRNQDELYHLFSINELQKVYPNIQWLAYINAHLPQGLEVNENEIVNVLVPSYFKGFNKLLETTNKRTIANYILWRIYEFSILFLSDEYRERQLKFLTTLWGVQENQDRWSECVYITSGSDSVLGIAIGSLYVRKHFDQNSKALALEIFHSIRSAFSRLLNTIEWMDETTKLQAKKKLYSMITHIGYPDELMDYAKVDEYYRKLSIDSSKYFESYLKMNVFRMDYVFNQLRQPVKKNNWIEHSYPHVVSAYYSPTENSIAFPASILQDQFFNGHRPMYINYAAIGTIIGHEITHGFDDKGRRFDHEGKLADWWLPETKMAFLEKVKCMIEQYGNFTEKQTGIKVNGITTQGENIADNGAFKEAYSAYKQWVVKNGEERKLPGLDYTPLQMFWISAAQMWCSKYRKETLKMSIETRPHLPGEFRITGSFRNNKDFSRDFNCAKGTPMNPVQKCRVW